MLGLELLHILRRGQGWRLSKKLDSLGPFGGMLQNMHKAYREAAIGVFSIYTRQYWELLKDLLGLTSEEAERRRA